MGTNREIMPTSGSNASNPVGTFRAADWPSCRRFAAWREALHPLAEVIPDPAVPVAAFEAALSSRSIGQVALYAAITPAQYVWQRQCSRTGPERASLCVVQCLSGGFAGYSGNQPIQAQPGDIVLMTLHQTLDIRMQPSRLLTAVVPYDSLSLHAQTRQDMPALVLANDSPVAVILGAHMQTTWQQVADGSIDDVKRVESMLINNIIVALTTAQMAHVPLASPESHAVFAAMQARIDTHLTEPLDVTRMAADFSCSRSSLYRLFKPFGGVVRYHRRACLHRCLAALVWPCDKAVHITELSTRYGFSSPSHFSRLFKKTFGVTPRQAKRQGEMLRMKP